MRHYSTPKQTEELDKAIQAVYVEEGAAGVQRLVPWATYAMITKRATRIGVKRQKQRAWTEEEVSYLCTHYHDQTSESIAERLNRTVSSIHAKARTLELLEHYERWLDDEERILETYYPIEGSEGVQERLGWIGVKRERADIRGAAHRRGIEFQRNPPAGSEGKRGPWDPDEKAYLEQQYGHQTNREIADRLRRTVSSVSQKAAKLGLQNQEESDSQETSDSSE